MFTHLKNIESAFQQNKRIVALVIITSAIISVAAIYFAFAAYQKSSAHIYVLANGKALEAIAADRKDNIPVEARDHIRMFHHYFFTLDPDEKVINGNISKAMYLADETARTQYNNLKEKSYYNNLISGNISQSVAVDSIQLDMNSYPYAFKCFATQKLIRSSSTIYKMLITQGYLRNVSRSDNNPHGFLIQHWETIANRDTTIIR
ncbi:conjugative transposon protein TraK [Mucilaginibacter myungsuensis]|uniref:Conjugative transposon protein TraK n=1 Tax=Mucilaginibacter myungsuensis TaxID=649104 RepID=A0A929PY99_9SPHI|nr:conjugative transposon protein TraK [Mucilaginibacter myungsuensis]MBE9663112.1 conjugative transposon protein TraK [Mucilaginibacter myungsuensis]MDN3598747.1 conjugative transposon protein TraK [Mucilaginibacter myungsuensis]